MDSVMTPAQKWAPYAYSAGQQLGIDPAFVLAQWLYETGNGTNTGATKYNNLAGIKSKPNAAKGIYDPSGSIHAGYTSLSAFTADYVRVMSLPYYKDFITTAQKGSVSASLAALNASPYSVADYNASGFAGYYKAASAAMGQSTSNQSFGLDFSSAFDVLSGVDLSGVMAFLKAYWWIIAIGLVGITIIRR